MTMLHPMLHRLYLGLSALPRCLHLFFMSKIAKGYQFSRLLLRQVVLPCFRSEKESAPKMAMRSRGIPTRRRRRIVMPRLCFFFVSLAFFGTNTLLFQLLTDDNSSPPTKMVSDSLGDSAGEVREPKSHGAKLSPQGANFRPVAAPPPPIMNFVGVVPRLTDSITSSWDNFERIVCLNLKERPDRLQHAKTQFSKAGIAHRVEYSITEKSSNGGRFGCFESHWKAIRQAYEDGLRNIAIFEDDVVFQTGWQSVINDCNAFVKAEPDWEWLNMNGPIYLVVEDSKSSKAIVAGKTSKTHAISLSRAGMKGFLELYPTPVNVGVDDAYMALLSKTYCHTTSNAIVQLEGLGTDNPWCFFDTVAGMESEYKAYIQNTYIPALDRVLSQLSLAFAMVPWSLRPWLVPQNFSEILKSDISVWRNGKEETFPWKVTLVGQILVTVIGLVVALTVTVPAGISRFKMIGYLLRI